MGQSVDVLFPVIVFVDDGTYSVAKDVHELSAYKTVSARYGCGTPRMREPLYLKGLS